MTAAALDSIATAEPADNGDVVIISILEFHSHLRPVLQAARVLTSMGYRVLIAAPGKLRELVAHYGYEFVQAGVEWATESAGALLADRLYHSGNDAFCTTIIKRYLTGPTAKKKADDIAALVQKYKVQHIFCDPTDIGALVAAWRMGLNCIRLENGWELQLARYYEALEIGMCDLWGKSTTRRFFADPQPPTLVAVPKELLYTHLDYVKDYAAELPQRPNSRLPAWVDEIPPDIPLFYGCYGGSILSRSEEFARYICAFNVNAAAAFEQIPCTAVLSVGATNVKRITAQFEKRFKRAFPDHVRLVAEIDQPKFLQFAGVAVMHHAGGLGTVTEQVLIGVPSVIVSTWSESFHVAERFARAGISDSVLHTATPEQIHDATLRLMTEHQRRNVLVWRRHAASRPTLKSRLTQLLAT